MGAFSPSGVWHEWDEFGGPASPFMNVTIGNGILVARWWAPENVVPAFATPPFLTFQYISLKFGSTTTVDATIIIGTPQLVDFGLEIDPFLSQGSGGTPDPFNPACVTLASASIPAIMNGRHVPGFGVVSGDATQIISSGDDPINDVSWNATTPAVWSAGSYLTVQRTFLGAFYGD